MLKIFAPLFGFFLAFCLAPFASAETTPLNGAAYVTKHQGVFNDVKVDYTATLAEIALTNDEGAPTASISSTAYVRTNVRNSKRRPVLFIWNGGPTAASMTLHMAGLGPKRLVAPLDPKTPIEPPFEVRDSAHALLDVADLVFVDPVETGLSRILPAGERAYFYSAEGDAESVAQYITKWLAAQKRPAAPAFVLGTSYGSIRAAMVAGALSESDTPLAGAILFSQGANLVETTQRKHNLVGYAVNMSQLAAIAHYHGRTAYQDLSVYDAMSAAYGYFMSDYLALLAAGRNVTDEQRRDAAQKLAAFTGISADYYLQHDLRIDKGTFRRELLKAEGLVLASNDARYVSPAGAQAPGDPAVQGVADAHRRHLTEFLGAGAQADAYRAFAPDAGDWDYGGWTTIGGRKVGPGAARSVFADYDWTGEINKAFVANPSFRLMIATGVYDTLTTAGPARMLADDVHLPGEGISLHEYEGGHSFYSNEAEFERLADDLRRFLTEPGRR